MGAVVNDDSSGAAATVRVLLADDEALMRSGLRLMIDGTRGIEVVGEAADGAEALELARDLHPDVILLDIRMPRMTGLEALARLREQATAGGPEARVVMLTAFDTDQFLLEALRGGAVSFLLKDSPPEEVVGAVLDAAADRPRFSPDVLGRLVRLAAHDSATSAASAAATAATAEEPAGADDRGVDGAAAPPEGVTAREWEVGLLAARGMTNQEICAQLFLSLATVKTHLGRLFDKLQVSNRVQLALAVIERGG